MCIILATGDWWEFMLPQHIFEISYLSNGPEMVSLYTTKCFYHLQCQVLTQSGHVLDMLNN